MIYIYPIGGLGNMFFHISSIYSLAEDNNDKLCLLNIDSKIDSLIKDSRWNGAHAPIFRYFLNRFPQDNKNVNNRIEHTFEYSPIPYKTEHEYLGYYQCEEYFKHRKQKLVSLFGPDDSFLPIINKYSELFGNISLHVRRGDYVNTQFCHPLQTLDYYSLAISLLPQELKIVVFSDDISWCKTNFKGDRYVFIEEMDYISIYIMAKMSYHIIANSSFSWWGAWLSDWKTVIAPKKWFNCCFPDVDIIPKEWIRI